MKSYLKRVLKDNDVHLSGVASMFLATKYEDIYHIPLRDFLTRVAHNKFKGLITI
jgi:cyclin B